MQIAYLITAHFNFKQLARLMRRLEGDSSHFFLHIDKKSSVKDSELNLLRSIRNVQLISRDYVVTWGTIGHVEATLCLMRAAAEKMLFDRIVLLTGTDYPLQSSEEISTFFKNNSECINSLHMLC